MLLELRQRLEIRLAPYLGQYLLPNAALTPAVWVGSVDGPRAGTNVTGLEAVLDLASLDVVNQYVTASINTRFSLHLLQWDGDQLPAAVDQICSAWPGTRVQRQTIPEGWGIKNWTTLEMFPKEVLG